MPILVQKTQLAAKLEASEGSPETPAAADALLIINPNFTPQIETHEQNLISSDLSRYKSLTGRRSGKINFDVQLKGSGAAGVAPEWGKLLKVCGFYEDIAAGISVTYTPTSAGIPSITLSVYMDGLLLKLWGARGSVAFNFSAGAPATASFVFTGADFSVEDAAILAGVSYDTTEPKIFSNAAFSIDSYQALIEKLELNINNNMQLRSDVNKQSGYLSAAITGRRPAGSLDPELPLVVQYDIFDKWRSGSEGALSLTLGTTAGNIINISAPKCRYSRLSLADRGDIRTLGADFELNRNTGDDELSIVLT